MTIQANQWTATETLGLTLLAGYSQTVNANGTLTITAPDGGGSSSDWQTILESVTYKNSADVANQTNYRSFTVTATPHSGTDVTGNNSMGSVERHVFYRGTKIRTPAGDVQVESLKPGDLVLAADGRILPIRWLGRQTVLRLFGDPSRVLPIRIRAGALAENVPCKDLLISPDHAVLVEGALIQAGALVNGSSITREENVPPAFVYYH